MGRETLRDTLLSVAHQSIEPGDEIIVVGDGAQPSAKGTVQRFRAKACPGVLDIRYMTHGPTRDMGNSQRNFAYQWAHGDWIVHMDDDDIFTEDAFIKIRKAIKQISTESTLLFKVKAPWGEIVWTTKGELEQGNLCTIQMVVPNYRSNLPRWNGRQGGNIPFIKDISERMSLAWRSEIIAICRPQAGDRWF